MSTSSHWWETDPSPRLDALSNALSAARLADGYEMSDLSPQEINRLSMSDYSKIRERAGLRAIDPFTNAYTSYEPLATKAPAAAQVPTQQLQDQVPDVAAMDWATYSQFRETSGIAARSAEGMSRASLSMADRWLKPEALVTGRRDIYR